MKNRFHNCIVMIKQVHSCDHSFIAIKGLSVIVSTIETYISTLYLKWIVDFIVSQIGSVNHQLSFTKYASIVFTVQIVAAVVLTLSILLSNVIIPRKEYKIKHRLQNHFIKKAMHQDLKFYEDFGVYDAYTKTVRYADTKALDVVSMAFSILGNLLKIGAILSIIAQLDFTVLFIITLMVILSLIDQKISNSLSYQLYEVEETINHQSEYTKRVAHHRLYAKEVRVFQLSDFLLNKLNESFKNKYYAFRSTNNKYWRTKYIILMISTLVVTPVLLIYIGYQTISQAISIGDFTVLFSSAFTVSTFLSGIVTALDNIGFESDHYIAKLIKMLETKKSMKNEG